MWLSLGLPDLWIILKSVCSWSKINLTTSSQKPSRSRSGYQDLRVSVRFLCHSIHMSLVFFTFERKQFFRTSSSSSREDTCRNFIFFASKHMSPVQIISDWLSWFPSRPIYTLLNSLSHEASHWCTNLLSNNHYFESHARIPQLVFWRCQGDNAALGP